MGSSILRPSALSWSKHLLGPAKSVSSQKRESRPGQRDADLQSRILEIPHCGKEQRQDPQPRPSIVRASPSQRAFDSSPSFPLKPASQTVEIVKLISLL